MNDLELNASILRQIRVKAYIAYVRHDGSAEGRDDHAMNPGAPAVKDFQDEYDRLVLVYGPKDPKPKYAGPMRRRSDKTQGGA